MVRSVDVGVVAPVVDAVPVVVDEHRLVVDPEHPPTERERQQVGAQNL